MRSSWVLTTTIFPWRAAVKFCVAADVGKSLAGHAERSARQPVATTTFASGFLAPCR
jgi:hypothetical protein